MSSRGRRVLSYEERVLWTTVTKAIAPLRATARRAPDEETEATADAVKPPRPAGPKKASPPWRRISRRRRWPHLLRRLAAA